jgi:NAD(P)-dependent dehydrogenase (short-subunit alcohol dehydrogenase family)
MNKVAWITGGGSGIGRAMALRYADMGWTVVVSGRRLDKLRETEGMNRGNQIVSMVCDVTNPVSVQDVVSEIINRFQRLDLVIANAGYAQSGRLQRLELMDWQRQFDVNVFGAATTASVAMPHLIQSNGQIAFVSSVMAYCRFPKSGAYSASKAAVTALAECYMLELKSSGVDCTVIHPGFIESEIGQIDSEGVFDPEAQDGRPKRFMWKADDAARLIQRRLDNRQSHITVTWHGFLGLHMARVFPRLTLWIQRTFG